MSENSNEGRIANKLGKSAACALIRKIGGVPLGGNSNRFIWKGKCAVMKTVNKTTNTDIGVYTSMLNPKPGGNYKPLDLVVAAYLKPEENAYYLYALDVKDFLDNNVSRLRPPKGNRTGEQWHANQKPVKERSCESRANERHGIPRRVSI